MNDSPTPDDVLRDIEFEILQGALGDDDLGQALQAARRFHLQSRHEILSSNSTRNNRELAVRQFQINDMLLALLQEMAGRLRRLQLELHRTAGLVPEMQSEAQRPQTAAGPSPGDQAAGGSPYGRDTALTPPPPDAAGASHELQVEAHIQPVRLPLLGRLLTRLRAAVHSLPVFYVQQLAEQQRDVNRTLSESTDQLTRLLAEQEAQIQALRQQVQRLRAQSESSQRREPE